MREKIQILEKEIVSTFDIVRLTDELDKDYESLTGIAILENVPSDGILYTSFVDGKELFPKNFELLFLQSNKNVEPNKRFFNVHGFKGEGNRIEIEYKDAGTASTYPYTIRIYLKLENEKTRKGIRE